MTADLFCIYNQSPILALPRTGGQKQGYHDDYITFIRAVKGVFVKEQEKKKTNAEQEFFGYQKGEKVKISVKFLKIHHFCQ